MDESWWLIQLSHSTQGADGWLDKDQGRGSHNSRGLDRETGREDRRGGGDWITSGLNYELSRSIASSAKSGGPCVPAPAAPQCGRQQRCQLSAAQRASRPKLLSSTAHFVFFRNFFSFLFFVVFPATVRRWRHWWRHTRNGLALFFLLFNDVFIAALPGFFSSFALISLVRLSSSSPWSSVTSESEAHDPYLQTSDLRHSTYSRYIFGHSLCITISSSRANAQLLWDPFLGAD